MNRETGVTDSELWARLADAEGLDRYDALCDLAVNAQQRGDYTESHALYEAAAEAAHQAGDNTAAGEAWRRRGSGLYNTSEYVESAAAYQRAYEAFAQDGREMEMSAVLWGRSDALFALAEFEQSLADAESCFALANVENSMFWAGEAALLQARCLYFLDREPEALEKVEVARDLFRSIQDVHRVRKADDFGITVALYVHDYDRALEYANNCLVIARSTKEPEDDANALWRTAQVQVERREFDEAFALLEQAVEAYRSTNDLLGMAHCHKLAGRAFGEVGDRDNGYRVLREARVLFETHGRDKEADECVAVQATMAHNHGDFQLAASLNAGLIPGEGREGYGGSKHLWAAARLADNLVCMGDFEGALEVCNATLDVEPDGEFGGRDPRVILLTSRVRAVHGLGQPEEAAEMAQEAIAQTGPKEVHSGTAYLYEYRAANGDEEEADRDIARAIALHLAHGNDARAAQLSQRFLPSPSQSTDKSDVNQRRDDNTAGPYL